MPNLDFSTVKGHAPTKAWLVLVAATGVGWVFSHMEIARPSANRWAMAGVIVTAFAKAWIIGFEFMELKRAPTWLRRAYDAWAVGVCATLLLICLG